MHGLRQDIVFGLRMLAKKPMFTTVAAFSLALGIGLNTAIFTLIHTILWGAVPYAQPDRIVAIRSVAPPETTEAISYGIPTFKYKGSLVWFAAFSKHCSLFPTASVIEQFRNELKGFATSKGTIKFTMDKPLPIALVKKMVKARVRQIEIGQSR